MASRSRSPDKTTTYVQSISFAEKPLLHALQFSPGPVDLMILKHDMPDPTEHIGWRALKDCIFSTLAVYLQQVDAFDDVVAEELTQGNSRNGAQLLRPRVVRGDHTLEFVRSINIHHCVPAICNRLVHRLDPVFVAVIGNVLQKQCPIPWRGFANDHSARIEAFYRVQGKVADKTADIYYNRVAGEVRSRP